VRNRSLGMNAFSGSAWCVSRTGSLERFKTI
jgi:hypothetical protein